MLTEFGFIENLRAKYGFQKIGDDCAVLPKNAKTDTVVTTDLLVEDIDFRLDWTTPELIGQKALAVSLSDVAAMGAKPVWSMISVGVPERRWRSDFLSGFYRGWHRLAKKFDVELVGGDVSRTPDRIVVDSIVAGEVKKGRAVLRSGARPGDQIFVSGALGGAAAGLRLLEQGVRIETAASWQKRLLERQLTPTPRVADGIELASNRIPSAMIDLSDGLSSDLAHLCRESGVGARIFADRIPFHPKLKAFTRSFDERLALALDGGEDFELLYTVAPKKILGLQKQARKSSFGSLGEITANAGIIELINGDKTLILEPGGFRHF
ncbi:MAG: thiamine-phosphate kinase [Acidobacteria bacterium]|nr:thiamine-phosphate kinase [Acidobacteriota bacterium]